MTRPAHYRGFVVLFSPWLLGIAQSEGQHVTPDSCWVISASSENIAANHCWLLFTESESARSIKTFRTNFTIRHSHGLIWPRLTTHDSFMHRRAPCWLLHVTACFFLSFFPGFSCQSPPSSHSKLTMFSFEGDFRTRPRVSLGGASKKVRAVWHDGRNQSPTNKQQRNHKSLPALHFTKLKS